MKLLGTVITIDHKQEKFKNTFKKASKIILLLRNAAKFTKESSDLKNIYMTFIRPVLEQSASFLPIFSNFLAIPIISIIFQPCPAQPYPDIQQFISMSKYSKPFPAISSHSSHFQQFQSFTAIYSHASHLQQFQPFKPFPAIPAMSIFLPPFTALYRHIQPVTSI